MESVTNISVQWLLIEYEKFEDAGPPLCIVELKSIENPPDELHTGKLVFVSNPGGGEALRAKIVISSDDKDFLDQQLVTMKEQYNIDNDNLEPESTETFLDEDVARNDLPCCHCSETNSEVSHVSKKLKRENGPVNRRKSSKPIRFRAHNLVCYSNNNKSPVQIEIGSQSPIDSLEIPISEYEDINTCNQESQTMPSYETLCKKSTPVTKKKFTIIKNKVKELSGHINQLQTGISCCLNTSYVDTENNQVPEQLCAIDSDRKPVIEINQQPLIEINQQPFIEINQQPLIEINQEQIETPKNKVIKNTQTPKHKEGKTRIHNNTCTEVSGENQETPLTELVAIGTGRTFVPLHILDHINWNSHTMATRKLLIAVFSRSTLATHSLTGRSSPAFKNKPAKMCLNPTKVNDIVITVTSKCKVKENLVRNAITTKCADENKMFRNRQKNSLKKRMQLDGIPETNDQENVPPYKVVKKENIE